MGVAKALLARGFIVFVPFIDDDYEFQPILPWIELDDFGYSYFSKTGQGGTLSLIIPQIMASIDYLGTLTTRGASAVALVGWEEGAFLAGITAAVDPRVGAVVKLMPPRDSRAMRGTALGTRVNAPFMQYDCVMGDVEQAALLSPRPLLFAYSDSDATLFRSLKFISTPIIDSIARLYPSSAGISVQHFKKGGPIVFDSVATWLGRHVAAGVAPVTDSVALTQPRDLSYPYADITQFKIALTYFVGRSGTCQEMIPDVSTTDSIALRVSTDRLRERVRIALKLRPPHSTRRADIVFRQVISSGPDYRLEWIYVRGDGESGDFGGLLATPLGVHNRVGAVLSFDGNYGVSQVFGLPPQGKTAYLGAYGDILARSGRVVFAPYRPTFVARGAPVIFAARGAAISRLQFELGLARRSVDVLLAQPTVDSSDVIAYGISEAAYSALYATAFDPRITGLVYSNPLVSNAAYFADPVNAAAGSWQTELCSSADDVMRYLIAPRLFTWEGDNTDLRHFDEPPLSFPQKIADLYRTIGLPDAFHYRRHLTGHETHVREIWDILPFHRRPMF